MCDKEDCIYRSENCGVIVTCDYLLITGELRGCGIGDECTRYTPGEKKNRWKEFAMVATTKGKKWK